MKNLNEDNHPARLLFDIILGEIRNVVHSEIAVLRNETRQMLQNTTARTKRFYSMKEAAAELNVSQATVRRLMERGLLHRNTATRLIRIPGTEIEKFAGSMLTQRPNER
jgi:excisionase family DNA binding protein